MFSFLKGCGKVFLLLKGQKSLLVLEGIEHFFLLRYYILWSWRLEYPSAKAAKIAAKRMVLEGWGEVGTRWKMLIALQTNTVTKSNFASVSVFEKMSNPGWTSILIGGVSFDYHTHTRLLQKLYNCLTIHKHIQMSFAINMGTLMIRFFKWKGQFSNSATVRWNLVFQRFSDLQFPLACPGFPYSRWEQEIWNGSTHSLFPPAL